MAPDVRVQVRHLGELTDADLDLVIFYDTLEHLDDPVHMLTLARLLLRSPRSQIVVASAIAEGPVWQEYRENWRSLDAPVHRVVPTLTGLSLLAEQAGLELVPMRHGCAARGTGHG